MKPRLDQLVLDIEFLLISVVQGVALASLAASAIPVITNLDYQYWPYILSGLIIILLFWAQAIVHSISFINWPLSLGHGFLYFLAAFVEVISFSQLTNPVGWYLANAVFFGLALVLYAVDLQMIKNRASSLDKMLISQALQEQRFGLFVLVPLGLAFNLLAWWQIQRHFQFHLAFALVQLAVGLMVLIYSVYSFRHRAKMLER